METETAKAIAERSNTGIVASIWRSGKNLGMAFFKYGKAYTWDDMTESERIEAVENFFAAGDFFARFVKSPKPDGSKVEELTRKTPQTGEDL